jgi:hypothetical protein
MSYALNRNHRCVTLDYTGPAGKGGIEKVEFAMLEGERQKFINIINNIK